MVIRGFRGTLLASFLPKQRVSWIAQRSAVQLVTLVLLRILSIATWPCPSLIRMTATRSLGLYSTGLSLLMRKVLPSSGSNEQGRTAPSPTQREVPTGAASSKDCKRQCVPPVTKSPANLHAHSFMEQSTLSSRELQTEVTQQRASDLSALQVQRTMPYRDHKVQQQVQQQRTRPTLPNVHHHTLTLCPAKKTGMRTFAHISEPLTRSMKTVNSTAQPPMARRSI